MKNHEFASLAESVRILGATETIVKRYAAQRLIGTQRLPGMPTRYRRADLLKLAERCTIPALVDQEELVGV